MVLDMLPSGELPHFENTIKWINSFGDFVTSRQKGAIVLARGKRPKGRARL